MDSFQQIIEKLRRPGLVTRFAPSSTGYLHFGHVVHALWVWLIARSVEAKIIFRIEDHDLGRARDQYNQSFYDDLEWLGLRFDEDAGTQSSRLSRYEEELSLLAGKGLVYSCECTRQEIIKRLPQGEGGELLYDGHCRANLPRSDSILRLKIPSGTIRFDEFLKGTTEQAPMEQCGDFVIRDRQGQWSYHWSNVIDDLQQGCNLIIRGDDILHATGRQIYLRNVLGAKQDPIYLHHSLALDEEGQKLSKRMQAHSLLSLRKDGVSAESLIAKAAGNMGVVRGVSEISFEDLLSALSQ